METQRQISSAYLDRHQNGELQLEKIIAAQSPSSKCCAYIPDRVFTVGADGHVVLT